MDFLKATDELMRAGVTLREMADAVGASYASIRQARLPAGTPSYRSPPPGWQEALAALARRRGVELQELAERLEG